MQLQKGVARHLLTEWLGEPAIRRVDAAETRCALRLQRCMLHDVVELYDFAPWTSHVIRRFCSVAEQHTWGGGGAKRRRTNIDE